MAQPQRPADVHQDELYPPNKRYALMDANNNIDLDNPLIAALTSVPRIYLGQFWHTLSPSNFKTTGLVQPWQTLGKILARCLTTRVTGHDHPPLQIMQMYYMTAFLKISQRAHDKYHNLEYDAMVKNIFNLGKHKDDVGMKIPSWMITDEMKLTDHYRMYAAVFGVDVPMTQSQPIESTQGTHRTTSTPRTPNPKIAEGESSASRKSTVIRLCIPLRRSTQLTPPTPILTTDEADNLVLQDTLQVSLAE
ncbi:hypothetical protein Tco_1127548 [Tanacetum coccineum]